MPYPTGKFAADRLYRTVRYDWLSHYQFESIDKVQDLATPWLWTYNHERLNSFTPKQKVAMAT